MTYPSSLPTAHKTATKQCCGRAVGRGDIVGKSRLLRAFYSALALLVLLSQATVLVAAPREISLVPFDIPRQSADDSLPAFGQQANVTVVYLFDDANSHHTNRLYGMHTLEKGIHILLKDSGLYAELSEDGHLIISSEDIYGDGMMKTKKNLLASTIAFFVGVNGQSVVAQDVDTEKDWDGFVLEEVVVTAQKREQRLIDVPISISAIGGDEVKKLGVQNIQDLAVVVPNFSVVEESAGTQFYFIRGVGNGIGSSPLVGVYLDEMPLSVSPSSAIDLQAIDLQRVEVLRGPQGTLFGQGSVGGTIRFITNSPTFDGFEGEIGLSAYDTKDGSLSKEATVIANIPVVDNTLAFRVAATYKDKGGWIDQPLENKKNINDVELSNLRLKGLLQVSDEFSVEAMIVRYRNDSGASNQTNIGDVTDSNFQVTPVIGVDSPSAAIDSEYDLYNIVLNYDLGFATLTSSSSQYDAQRKQASISFTAELDPPFFGINSLDVFTTDNTVMVDGFSQEIRLVGNSSQWDWVVGAFYADVTDDFMSSSALYLNGIPILGPPSDTVFLKSSESMAFFADISYNITEQLTVALGTRYFEDDRTFRQPPLALQSDDFDNLSSKMSLSYAITESASLYLSAAEGFRSGGFNSGVDVTYDPETVTSYELGAKAALWDGRLNADGAIFHSIYSDFQSNEVNLVTQSSTVGNPGEAEIQGIEFSTRMMVSDSISVGVSGNVTDAEFTETSLSFPTFIVGDRVNFIPKYSYSINADFDFDWSSSIAGFAHIDYNRQGPSTYTDRTSLTPLKTAESSALNMLNVQIGGQWDSFTIQLFGRNLTNELRATAPNVANFYAQHRPRTLGIDLNYQF